MDLAIGCCVNGRTSWTWHTISNIYPAKPTNSWKCVEMRKVSSQKKGTVGATLKKKWVPMATTSSGGNMEPSQEKFADVMANILSALGNLQTQQDVDENPGANVLVKDLCFHPAGAPSPLLNDISLELQANRLGLIFGRSGAGKSTLLQVIAGLLDSTKGDIVFHRGKSSINMGNMTGNGLTSSERMKRAGIVFQFPERHFVGSTLAEELTAGWPGLDNPLAMASRQSLTVRAYEVLSAVGLDSLPIDIRLESLSDGYKRRVALAVQLVRRPELLLLDEPLAGLDWKTRAELVKLLSKLKEQSTVLVVSHDLRELAPLADKSWRMHAGGKLSEEVISL